MKKGRGHHHLCAQILQTDVQHFNADSIRNLREILTGHGHPRRAILNQDTAAARIATEILTEMRGESVIPRSVHFDVVVQQLTDHGLTVGLHRFCSCLSCNWFDLRWPILTGFVAASDRPDH